MHPRRWLRPLVRRGGPVLLAVALLGVPGPSGADTRDDLAAARDRVRALERRIESERRDVDRLRAEMLSLIAERSVVEARYRSSIVEATAAREAFEAARSRYEAVRERLEARVRAVYMHGAAPAVDVILGAGTVSDLSYGMEYQRRLAVDDAALAVYARRLAEERTERRDHLAAIETGQVRLLNDIDAKRERLVEAFAEQQAALARLASVRSDFDLLVVSLERRFRNEERRAARASVAVPAPASGEGLSVTYGEWAQRLLQRLGDPVCRDNLVVLVAWQTAEGTSATWNPLATTLPMPGATTFNSHGVRNYVSFEQGLRATILTLERGADPYGYAGILASLRACADAMVTGTFINRSSWCRGCAGGRYVLELIPVVEAYYDRYASQ